MFRIKRSKADKIFSDLVRMKAHWNCERCFKSYRGPTQSLHCSHFWGRGNKSVRFDFDNAASLDFKCHQYLGSNPVEHREFFLKRLGQDRFEALNRRVHFPSKIDERIILIGLEMELNRMKEEEGKNIIGYRHGRSEKSINI